MQSALGVLCISLLFLPFQILEMGPKKTTTKKVSRDASSSCESFDSTRFHILENFKKYDSLVKFRSIWSERKVYLDELDAFIQQNLDYWSWLLIFTDLDSPLATIIREFYSNLSVYFAVSSGHILTTWIRCDEYQITKKVVADALSIPLVYNPTYPYIDLPSLNDVMSLLCGKPMTWIDKHRLDTSELTKLNYQLYKIACHSVFPISHRHTIPIDQY